MGLKRIASVARYLSWTDPVWTWRFSRAHCPSCGVSVFISMMPHPFMTRCLRCTANVTNLSLIPVIDRHFRGQTSGKCAYELSTYGATLEHLERNFSTAVTSEYFPGRPLGELHNGILNQDVTALTFEDETFDLVTSNQVFEHVPDLYKGYRECCRVLKKGGAMIFSVPLHDFEETQQAAEMVDGELRWFGSPEYHDSRLGGPKSAPVFWRISVRDATKHLLEAGFSKATIVDVVIAPSQAIPAPVIYAIK